MLFIKKYPKLESKRLLLNRLEKADLGQLVLLAGDQRVSSNTVHIPHPYSLQDAKNFLDLADRKFMDEMGYVFAIRPKETKELIGGIGIHLDKDRSKAELGYWIGVPHWGNGYATEALKTILPFAFGVRKLEKAYAHCFSNNKASAKVLENAGFRFCGTLLNHFEKNGRPLDVDYYEITEAELLPNTQPSL